MGVSNNTVRLEFPSSFADHFFAPQRPQLEVRFAAATHVVSTSSVHEFGKRLIADCHKRGLDAVPELFPGQPRWDHYGDWLRLPGRHHSRAHFTRVRRPVVAFLF